MVTETKTFLFLTKNYKILKKDVKSSEKKNSSLS